MTDEQLIISADENSQAALIERYVPVIKAKAGLLKNKYIDTDDLVSEGFLGLLNAIRCYNVSKGTFSAFARTCIVNKMKNAVMSAITATKNSADLSENFDFGSIEDTNIGTEELIILRERNGELLKKIENELSSREKEVFYLYLSAYSYAQIAKKLNISVKSVDNAIARAKSKLRNLF